MAGASVEAQAGNAIRAMSRAMLRSKYRRNRTQGDVVQLVRTPACHVGGRGFEPRRPRHSFQSFPGSSNRHFRHVSPLL
jgi:hypothetical protein